MTTPDFRALCAELVETLSKYQDRLEETYHPDSAEAKELDGGFGVLERARAALAQPEAEGPTEDQLDVVMADHFDEPQGEARKSAESASKPRLDLLPADRFRLGDIWRSPRGKDWQVDKVEGGTRGIARLRALHNRHSTQWRGIWETGGDMTNAWERIESAADPVTYP